MDKDLQTLNNQNKLAMWANRISACRSSGQNVKTWCKENGICEQTYYKWQKRLFESKRQLSQHLASASQMCHNTPV